MNSYRDQKQLSRDQLALVRHPVRSEQDAICETLAGRVVVATGLGASTTSGICRQMATCQPRRLLVVDQSEGHLFRIERDLLGRERLIV